MLKYFNLSSLTLGLGAALIAMAAVPALKADGLDNHWQTTVTFSGPVDIGNTCLTAGTYVFRIPDYNDRNLVEIMNSDQTREIALVRAVSASASQPFDNTKIDLKETASGTPERVHEWFYPGSTIGWEFPADHNTSTE